MLSSKDFNYDLEQYLDDDESIEGYDRDIYNYLEIPIHFAYKLDAFQIYAGPYVAIGIGAKNEWDNISTYDDGEVYRYEGENRYKPVFGEVGEGDISSGESPFRALDFGLNFGIGYEVGPILINAGYSMGLGNLTPAYEGFGGDPSDFKNF